MLFFSHYDYFDQLLDKAIGTGDENWETHERVSYIYLDETWIPYPFQNNISVLSIEKQILCLNGLINGKILNTTATNKPANFDEWIIRVMGDGIANIFMRPYNFKVWAVPTTLMQCDWLGERVATVNIEKAVTNILKKKLNQTGVQMLYFVFQKLVVLEIFGKLYQVKLYPKKNKNLIQK